jgi:hypothetical protein
MEVSMTIDGRIVPSQPGNQPSQDLNAPPPVAKKATLIPEGDLNKIHSVSGGKLPHVFIADEIQKLTGEEFNADFATKPDFKISCGFADPKKDKDAPREMYTFKSPEGVECFGVKRYVTITWKENGQEQKFTTSFNIELGLKVPLQQHGQSNEDFEAAMKQGMYMAGIAGKMAAEPWELMVKNQVGQASGASWDKLKPQMDKIQKDRFVTLELISNGKTIKVDKTDQANTFKTRNVTQVKLHIPSEGDNPPAAPISYLKTVDKTNDQHICIIGKQFDEKNWVLSIVPARPEPAIHSVGDKRSTKRAPEAVLSKKTAESTTVENNPEKPQKDLQEDWDKHLNMLNDGSGLHSLVNEFATETTPAPNLGDDTFISNNFTFENKPKTLLERGKAMFLPKKTYALENGKVLDKLSALLQDSSTLNAEKMQDLKTIAKYSRQALVKMTAINNALVDASTTKNDQEAKRRLQILNNFGDKLEKIEEYIAHQQKDSEQISLDSSIERDSKSDSDNEDYKHV